ncbi:hypothetical protein [Nesterenkonia sedimenti]|nr:hypothetical protein [Nesterenkonia sedimenti]
MSTTATVDADQLNIMLEKIAAISEPGPGITRMAYSPQHLRQC